MFTSFQDLLYASHIGEQSERTEWLENISRCLTVNGLGIAFQKLCKWKIQAAKEAGGLFVSPNTGTATMFV